MKLLILISISSALSMYSLAGINILPTTIEVEVEQGRTTSSYIPGDSNPIFDDLPPHPGPDNDLTIAGIDSDSDGVRDDIQRLISIQHAEQAALRLAMLDTARLFQSILFDVDDVEKSRDHAVTYMRRYECVSYVLDEKQSVSGMWNELIAVQMNTYDRSMAYIQFQKNISGEMLRFRNSSKWNTSCSFDAASLLGEN